MDDVINIGSDLLKFTQWGFERSNKKFIVNWHHRVIADKLMSVFKGEIKRLIINLPPRYTKTELAVVNFMAWSMGIIPDCEFIHASYSKRLATNNAYHCRALVQSEAYREIFPNVQLKDDSKAKDEWRTSAGGIVYATGSDGTITGYGAGKMRDYFGGCVIIDDPHKANESESKLRRKNVIDWFQSTIESRLNSPHTPIIVIMQRLHEDDLAGWLLSGGNGEVWDNLCIPVLNENDDPLWEFKHDRKKLKQMEESNPYGFSGQYMQRPVPREGGMVKSIWFADKRYREHPQGIIRTVQSWDTAFKTNQINDPSVCTTWIEGNHGYYLIDCYVLRGDYPAVKRAIQSKHQQFNPDAVLIEDKASGQSLIQELRQTTTIPVIAINPTADKETRMYSSSGLMESGRVWLPEVAPWLAEYESELFTFPLSKHDDQVDSTSQFLNWAKKPQEILIG